MSKEVDQLTTKLSKLSVIWPEIISELQTIDKEYRTVQELLGDLKKPKKKTLGTDVKENSLSVGDNVTTLTKGKYYKRITTVKQANPRNHIGIEYKTSNKSTWRVGSNLLKF